jgi:putative serine protease PepD
VAPPAAAARRGLGITLTIVVAGAVALVVGLLAGLTGYLIGSTVEDRSVASAPASSAPAQSSPADAPRPAGSVAAIAEGTLPAVVTITAEGQVESGSGSGFVIRPDGYIVTNNHVVSLIAEGGELTVVFSDGQRVPGTVVGTSQAYDLAVVKVDRSGLPTVQLGDSGEVRVGDDTIAIGAPLGLDGTVTTGIVSALDRPVQAGDSQEELSYINAIQTDAAINPGNSGGPLLNAAGDVIGVNTAIATLMNGEMGNIGLGFAIPINSAKRVAEELIATGTSRTPLLGVSLAMGFAGGGAQVEDVTVGSAAANAGLRVGDVITRVDERPIDDAVELIVTVRNYTPGDTIEVEYRRDGEARSTSLVLGSDGS